MQPSCQKCNVNDLVLDLSVVGAVACVVAGPAALEAGWAARAWDDVCPCARVRAEVM